eukprot:6177297-Pleurochrysis_carterae.AAC.1
MKRSGGRSNWRTERCRGWNSGWHQALRDDSDANGQRQNFSRERKVALKTRRERLDKQGSEAENLDSKKQKAIRSARNTVKKRGGRRSVCAHPARSGRRGVAARPLSTNGGRGLLALRSVCNVGAREVSVATKQGCGVVVADFDGFVLRDGSGVHAAGQAVLVVLAHTGAQGCAFEWGTGKEAWEKGGAQLLRTWSQRRGLAEV